MTNKDNIESKPLSNIKTAIIAMIFASKLPHAPNQYSEIILIFKALCYTYFKVVIKGQVTEF